MASLAKALLGIAAGAALLVAGGIGLLAVERTRPLMLPRPTGRFAVGRVVYDWIDSTESDPLAPRAGTPRELLVWVWYPAAGESGAATESYVPAAIQAKAAVYDPPFPLDLFTRQLGRVHESSVPNAAVATAERAYPVLVMRGGASARVASYSTLALDLASRGYVVAGFDAPYRTQVVVFPDGRVVRRTAANDPELVFGRPDSARTMDRLLAAWATDTRFVVARLQQLDAFDPDGRFTGRLDLSRLGAFGHSLGGIEAAQFCVSDPRCRAVADVDGAPIGPIVHDTITRALMFLLSDHTRDDDPESRAILADMRSIYDRAPANRRVWASIRGANHFTFSDDGALLKSGVMRWLLTRVGLLGIDGRRQLDITAYALGEFFDAYLNSPAPGPPPLAAREYPELRVTTP